MNWQQQPIVDNGSCTLLAPQCFFKRVSRSEVFLPGCQWKVLVFRSVSVHCESPHIQEQLLGKTWCPCILNLYQFSALRRFTSIQSWMSFQMFPYWQKECSAFQWEIDFCVCVCSSLYYFSGYWLGSNRKACVWAGFQPSLPGGTSFLLPDREQVCPYSLFLCKHSSIRRSNKE